MNNIYAILNSNDVWIIERDAIGGVFCVYKKLYTYFNLNFLDGLQNLICLFVSEKCNDLLCAIPTGEEIHDVLFALKIVKESGARRYDSQFL